MRKDSPGDDCMIADSVTLNSRNSLIPANNYLFFEIFSLLICVRNCAKSRCGTAVSCFEIVPQGPEIAEFPVKFPVSREFAWRPVRSPLRRQPTSPAPEDFTQMRLRAILAGHTHFRTILEEAGTSAFPSRTMSIDPRMEALDRLARLRLEISELERELIGIGHNRPPEPLFYRRPDGN